ncbi:xanthine/uracil/vitamin C permease [Alkalihalobacillus sp. 1P02AB]|uniref:xanthine/uracil/vitamin C permease n=1 Tax=Alkalihalobacillus sp. 1P02AB TaxID=3132260 RepID=UPI0039A46B0D
MSLYKRKEGSEQPYWQFGPFKLRFPFIHYRLEGPEIIQGFVLFSIGLSMIPILQNYVGMTFDAALAVVIIFQMTMLLQVLLGSPFVSGLITPLIPLLVIFLSDFTPGPEAIQALVAVQLLVAIIFLLFGITGMGRWIVNNLSTSLKSGILIGAGLAALFGEFQAGGTVAETPISLIIGGVICLFVMFSPTFKSLIQRNNVAGFIANYGIMPSILIAIIIGWIVREYPSPTLEWGITVPNFVELWNYTPFVVGFPSFEIFLLALPLAILGYVIGYGDIIVGKTLIEKANEKRPDEKVDTNVSQLHVIVFIRNLIHAFFAPHPGLAGPIFTAGMASVAERYTYGKKAMESIHSGAGTLLLTFLVALFILPLVTFFQPFLPIALSITLILTGYICITVGLEQVKTPIARGVALIMAVVLAIYGAAHALIVGILLYFLIERNWVERTKDNREEKRAS